MKSIDEYILVNTAEKTLNIDTHRIKLERKRRKNLE